jgi:hypothetical protein
VTGLQPHALEDDHEQAEPDGQRREYVVEHDRSGELQPAQDFNVHVGIALLW